MVAGDGEFLHTCCEQAAELFMVMPREPFVIKENGKEVLHYSTAIDAADVVISHKTLDDKLTLFTDIMLDEEGAKHDPDVLSMDVPMTGAEIIDALFSQVLAEKIRRIPDVMEREDANFQKFDEMFNKE